jgi:hypothetical protein
VRAVPHQKSCHREPVEESLKRECGTDDRILSALQRHEEKGEKEAGREPPQDLVKGVLGDAQGAAPEDRARAGSFSSAIASGS